MFLVKVILLSFLLSSPIVGDVITFPTGNQETFFYNITLKFVVHMLSSAKAAKVVIVSVSYEGLEGGSQFYNIP